MISFDLISSEKRVCYAFIGETKPRREVDSTFKYAQRCLEIRATLRRYLHVIGSVASIYKTKHITQSRFPPDHIFCDDHLCTHHTHSVSLNRTRSSPTDQFANTHH